MRPRSPRWEGQKSLTRCIGWEGENREKKHGVFLLGKTHFLLGRTRMVPGKNSHFLSHSLLLEEIDSC